MTSCPLINCLKRAAPCDLPRSSVMQRLLRATDFHQSGMPSLIGSSLRWPSPYLGCSILITSAPKSASNTVANGAATRSEEHTSELQSPYVISYAVFLFLMMRRPPTSPLFPYTTLFRSITIFGMFDLDHVSAEIREQYGRERRCDHVAGIDHAHAFERFVFALFGQWKIVVFPAVVGHLYSIASHRI